MAKPLGQERVLGGAAVHGRWAEGEAPARGFAAELGGGRREAALGQVVVDKGAEEELQPLVGRRGRGRRRLCGR